MIRCGAALAAVLSLAVGIPGRAQTPAAEESPPFQAASTPARDDLLRRFEEMDVLQEVIPPQQVIDKYRALYQDALKEYGPDAYEPYAILDRLAGFHDNRSQSANTPFAGNVHPEQQRRAFAESTKAMRREVISAIGRSKVADWRRLGEIAKHEGLIELSEGRVAEARPRFDEAAKRLGEHPDAGAYSLARVLLAQAQVAGAERRWDEAEKACDELIRLFHRMDAQSLDVLSLDVLATAEGRAAYHLAFTLATRQAAPRDRVEKYAEWNLNTKVHRREVFGRQLASLRADEGPEAVRVRSKLFDSWRRLSALAVQPARGRVDRDMQRRQGEAIQASLAEVKTLAREAARITTRKVGGDEWIAIDRVRAALPPDAVLIDFYSFLEYDFDAPPGVMTWKAARDIAFVIPPAGRGEVRMVDLGDGMEIWKAVDAFVRRFGPPDGPDADSRREAERAAADAGREVSRLVLHPLIPHVKDARRWIFSPHALTWVIPWSALSLEDGALVVERHATSNVLAGRHVAQGVVDARPAGAAGPPLIAADPDYDLGRADGAGEGPFGPLHETAAEARAVAPLLQAYAGVAPRILLGGEARESAVLAPPAPRVLFASTHGYYGRMPDALVGVNSAMLRCGLAFAGANERRPADDRPGDDGVATGLEILASDFRGTDLVVLSACETSYGEFQTSQGLIGLNLAFHLAGAKAVMGSLWPVPVEETGELTTEFFSELARGTPADESLRRSQAKLLQRLRKEGGAPPWYWAAFLISGDAASAAAP